MFKQISIGSRHTLYLTNNREVYAFGFNDQGQLGLGDYIDRMIPTLIPTLHNIVQISAGKNHSLALTQDNIIYAWGNNEFSQLGISATEHMYLRNIPTQMVKSCSMLVIEIIAENNHSIVIMNDISKYFCGLLKIPSVNILTLVNSRTEGQSKL